jgi:hypothetical protein
MSAHKGRCERVPFLDQDLLERDPIGLARDCIWRENEEAIALLRSRFDSLTQRLMAEKLEMSSATF